jgi:hypothetical protein
MPGTGKTAQARKSEGKIKVKRFQPAEAQP